MLLCLFGVAAKWSCHTTRSHGHNGAQRDFLGMQLYSLPVLQQVAKPSTPHSQQGTKTVTVFREILLQCSFASFPFPPAFHNICLK